jgi:hypothetical protein
MQLDESGYCSRAKAPHFYRPFDAWAEVQTYLRGERNLSETGATILRGQRNNGMIGYDPVVPGPWDWRRERPQE